MRFCLCIFESDTVNCKLLSYADFYENYEIFNTDCWFTLLVLMSGDINWSFSELFFPSPNPKSKKIIPYIN